jgi:hypothetical protein
VDKGARGPGLVPTPHPSVSARFGGRDRTDPAQPSRVGLNRMHKINLYLIGCIGVSSSGAVPYRYGRRLMIGCTLADRALTVGLMRCLNLQIRCFP